MPPQPQLLPPQIVKVNHSRVCPAVLVALVGNEWQDAAAQIDARSITRGDDFSLDNKCTTRRCVGITVWADTTVASIVQRALAASQEHMSALFPTIFIDSTKNAFVFQLLVSVMRSDGTCESVPLGLVAARVDPVRGISVFLRREPDFVDPSTTVADFKLRTGEPLIVVFKRAL